MIKIEVSEETHVVMFDSKNSLTAQYTFKLVLQEIKVPEPGNERVEPAEQRQGDLTFDLWVENNFSIKWQSQYFELREEKESIQYGQTPFSLETFLELYRDPRKHRFLFLSKPKSPSLIDLTSQPYVGRLLVRTTFSSNPFLYPLRSESDCQKSMNVITVTPSPEKACEEFVVCSGRLVNTVEMEEYADFIFAEKMKEREKELTLTLYQYEIPRTVEHRHICILKSSFNYKRIKVADADILILSEKPHPIESIPSLKDHFSRIASLMPLRTVVIVQNVQTHIQEADGVVFFSRSVPLYQRLFRSYLYSKVKDQWLIHGMVNYRNNSRDLHVKWNDLCDLVGKGEQFSPISDPEYSMDEVWKLKAIVVYYMIANLTRQGDKLTNMLLSSIKDGGKKMNLESFVKTIKNKYGLVAMKTYTGQFVKGTGIPRLYHEFGHVKKENKIVIQIRQKPLQSATFQFYNTTRIRLEEAASCKSMLIEKIIEKNNKTDEIHKPSATLKKKEGLLGPLLVPHRLKSNAFMRGKLPVVIAETNEMDYREEEYQFNLKKKKITKESVNCRSKLRKTINKKGLVEKEGSRLPSWMKLDQSHTFLFLAKNQNMDELKLQRQLAREKNEMEMLKVIQLVKQYPKDNALVTQLCSMLEIKETNTTSLQVRQQILSIFPIILANSEDKKPWDEINQLLKLYEPVCYDRSVDGHNFKIALLECLSKLKYVKAYSTYFEQFHRILLAMSKESENHFTIHEQVDFRKSLYKAMLTWYTKYTLDIVTEVHDVCEVYAANLVDYGKVLKVMIDRGTNYIEQLEINPDQHPIISKTMDLFRKIVDSDKTYRLWLSEWGNMMLSNEKEMPTVDYFMLIDEELEDIRVNKSNIYEQALKIVKDILVKNKKKYALQMQLNVLTTNQNLLIAQRLWQRMTTGESLTNPGVRLYWMKIYRVLYFYFTPICVPAKLKQTTESTGMQRAPFEFNITNEEREQILDMLKDFVPDLEWLSGYDAYHRKSDTLRAQDREENQRSRHKKKAPKVKINLGSKNIMVRWVQSNPDKQINWNELSKRALDIIIEKLQNKRTKTEIVNQLKAVKKKLKRGNMPKGYTFKDLQTESLKVMEEGEQDTSTLTELFQQCEGILEKVVRQQDTKVILPADILKRDSDELMKKESGMDAMIPE